MGDAAGELAHALQSPQLVELGLERLALVHGLDQAGLLELSASTRRVCTSAAASTRRVCTSAAASTRPV